LYFQLTLTLLQAKEEPPDDTILRLAHSTLIHAYAAEGLVDMAIKHLDKIAGIKIHPTEVAIGSLITSSIWSRRIADASSMFLRMRDLWCAEQHRFEERGLTFYEFNRPYQDSFAELRRAVGLPYPDMVHALASYRDMVPCDREYLLHQGQEYPDYP